MKVQSLKPVPKAQPTCHSINPQKLLQSIVDVVFAIDEHGIFHYVSVASEQLFGYTPDEMTGRSFLNFIHPDDIEKTIQIVLEKTHDCKTSNFENRYFKKDGTELPLVWSGRWDENDQLVVLCSARRIGKV